MRSAKLMAVLLLIASASRGATPWPKEPLGFRNASWNGTLEDFRRALPNMDCRGRGAKGPICEVRLDVGDVQTKLSLAFLTQFDNRLWSIIMDFRHSDYKTMMALFREKYGPPTHKRDEAGLPVYEWNGRLVDIEITPGDSSTPAGASFTVRDTDHRLTEMNRLEERQRAAAKKALRKNAKSAF